MQSEYTRRDFLKTTAKASTIGAIGRSIALHATSPAAESQSTGGNEILTAFNYNGVRLLDGMLRRQYLETRNYYFNLSDEDILKGFRRRAGLPAPGKDLGGWCEPDCSMMFGQWLSGMARMYKATGDTQMRDKAVYLMTQWARTIGADGTPYSAGGAKDLRYSHYTWDKLACGLIDLHEYGEEPEALSLLEGITNWASANLDRTRSEPSGYDISGFPPEWYTLSENLYRAYFLSGDPRFKVFGDVWRDDKYWGLFATPFSCDVGNYHAYSHANSLSSAAMTYAVTGQDKYLRYIIGSYEHFQHIQCYATGGFGPAERLVSPNAGELGRALEREANTFETPCGSWAVFKLARYLIQFTGQAKYGDWIERILYNGIGAALRMGPSGATFYYSDYRLAGGDTLGSARKEYYWDAYPCCSGTYIQDVADFHNIIYFKDKESLYVNLFIPSEVTWKRTEGDILLRQVTSYPEQDTTQFDITVPARAKFKLKIRIPQWAEKLSVTVNGAYVDVPVEAGWAMVERIWTNGDRVNVQFPMQLRAVPVDNRHPNRVAIAYGPVVLVQDGRYTLPLTRGMDGEKLSKQIVRLEGAEGSSKEVVDSGGKLQFRITDSAPKGVFSPAWGLFMPFYEAQRGFPYRMYFDLDEHLDVGVPRT